MKILAFSDLHSHNYAQHSHRLGNGLNSRFRDCLNIMEQARSIALDKKVDLIVFAGDLYESRTNLPVEVFCETHRAMRHLATAAPIHFLLGNHDLWAKGGTVTAVEALRDIDNLRLIGSPETVYGDPNKEGRRPAIHYIPHRADPDQLLVDLEAVPGCDLLFLHQTFSEATIGPADHKIQRSPSMSSIPIGRIGAVISGDIHKKQTLPAHCFNYLGSPLQLNFGERGEEKSFLLIDTDKWEFTDIPTNAPRFFWIHADGDPAEAFKEQAADSRPDIDFIRLSYHGKWETRSREMKEHMPKIELDMLAELRTPEQRVTHEQIVAGGDAELLTAWLDQWDELPNGLDKDVALQVGLDELSEVTDT